MWPDKPKDMLKISYTHSCVRDAIKSFFPAFGYMLVFYHLYTSLPGNSCLKYILELLLIKTECLQLRFHTLKIV